MSNPYPPPPRRLLRSTSNRVVGGVCGGVAQYLNMDANLVRILTVLLSLFTGVPVVLYIIALFVVPEESAGPGAPPPVTGAPTYADPFAGSQPMSAYAPYPGAAPSRPAAEDPVWGSEGAPWEQRQPEPTPDATPAPAATPAAPTPPSAASPEPAEPVAATEPTGAAEPTATEVTPEPVAPAQPEAPVVPPEAHRREGSTSA